MNAFMPALVGLVGIGFAQVNVVPILLQNIAIGVAVWLATAVLAYVAWTLLKVIAKIGVVVIPILAGIAVAVVLPGQATSNTIMMVAVPCVLWGIAGSLVCYLYANFYNIERDLGKVESQQSEATPASTPKTGV